MSPLFFNNNALSRNFSETHFFEENIFGTRKMVLIVSFCSVSIFFLLFIFLVYRVSLAGPRDGIYIEHFYKYISRRYDIQSYSRRKQMFRWDENEKRKKKKKNEWILSALNLTHYFILTCCEIKCWKDLMAINFFLQVHARILPEHILFHLHLRASGKYPMLVDKTKALRLSFVVFLLVVSFLKKEKKKRNIISLKYSVTFHGRFYEHVVVFANILTPAC